jgi:PIN domain nuclease of toxin-antitoxin system
MRLLLDTHAWLWMLDGSPKLGGNARAAILDPANEVFASAASAYEIALKVRQGKLAPLPKSFAALCAENALDVVQIAADEAERAGGLALAVRDPFDRMIVAQALCRGLTVASRDPALTALGATAIW